MDKENTGKILPRLLYPHGMIAEMARDLDVSRDAISDAMNGKTHHYAARLIRNVAVRFYGAQEPIIP